MFQGTIPVMAPIEFMNMQKKDNILNSRNNKMAEGPILCHLFLKLFPNSCYKISLPLKPQTGYNKGLHKIHP
jgi:hypothetical protein